jgi:hypothetical protein
MADEVAAGGGGGKSNARKPWFDGECRDYIETMGVS